MSGDHTKATRQRNQANGKCTECGKSMTDGLWGRCKPCRTKLQEADKKRRANRVQKGLCSKCGVEPALPGTRCEKCGVGKEAYELALSGIDYIPYSEHRTFLKKRELGVARLARPKK